jgi:ribosome maturation factor RimP
MVRESALFYWTQQFSTMAQTSREALISRIAGIAERVARPAGIEVIEVELAGSGRARLLRIYIDRPEGVTHADCELVSDRVGTVLDSEDVIPGGGYQLEVSSPGVERKLMRPSDYERFAGKKAKLVLSEPVDDQKHWEGTLRGLEEGAVVKLEAAAGRMVRVPLASIRKANLKFEW